MPPPRLSRHLRPCHPLGSAPQVRCASKTARVKSSTDGDDAPQRSSSQINEAQEEHTSWWSAAISRIASIGAGTVRAEPEQLTPNSPTAIPPELREERAQTIEETVQGKNHGHSEDGRAGWTRRPHVERLEEAYNRMKAKEAHEAHEAHEAQAAQTAPDGEAHSTLTIRKHVSHKGTTLGVSLGQAAKMAPKQDVTQVSRGKDNKRMPQRENAAEIPQKDDTVAIQQQLQQLFEQVRTLQAALAAKPASEKSTSTTETKSERLPTPGTPTSTPATEARVGPKIIKTYDERQPNPKYLKNLHKRAWAQYRGSTSLLIRTARTLGDMPPHIVAPITASILHRICVIAATEKDPKMKLIVGEYKEAVASLTAGLDSLTILGAKSNATQSISQTAYKGRNTTSGPLQHSRILQLFLENYRSSTGALVDAANVLEEMQSSAAVPIASKLNSRLRAIAEDAKAEKDKEMGAVLRAYRNWRALYAGIPSFSTAARQSTRTTKPETADVRPRASETDETDVQTQRGKLQAKSRERTVDESKDMDDKMEIKNAETKTAEKDDGQRLARQIHTESRLMSSSDHSKAGKPVAKTSQRPVSDAKHSSEPADKASPNVSSTSDEVSDQSLLEELFPEASSPPPSRYTDKRDQYPKLDLPNSIPIVRRWDVDPLPSLKNQVVESFQKKRERVTVLQLIHCSTELTEADFRRLVPKGKHIESWRRDGDFDKVIPGRDPLSLERMPFYYLLFKDPESALAYQKNASRLHKLNALHQPSSIFSAVQPPRGFLEDGEDLNRALSNYNLLPTHHHLSLNMLVQPYNPALRDLVERGGYNPVVPDVDDKGNRIWKVLMHIEGYEPTPTDLFRIFSRDSYKHGMSLPLRNESSSSIHRLRDLINLKTTHKPISSVRPRAYGTFDHAPENRHAHAGFEDPAIQFMMAGAEEDSTAKDVNQLVMNRVYNRWVIDFDDEDAATRFARSWHRRELPDATGNKGGWRDMEETRICNAEVLW